MKESEEEKDPSLVKLLTSQAVMGGTQKDIVLIEENSWVPLM